MSNLIVEVAGDRDVIGGQLGQIDTSDTRVFRAVGALKGIREGLDELSGMVVENGITHSSPYIYVKDKATGSTWVYREACGEVTMHYEGLFNDMAQGWACLEWNWKGLSQKHQKGLRVL